MTGHKRLTLVDIVLWPVAFVVFFTIAFVMVIGMLLAEYISVRLFHRTLSGYPTPAETVKQEE